MEEFGIMSISFMSLQYQAKAIYALSAINPRGLSKDFPIAALAGRPSTNETNHPENAFAMQEN